MPWNWLKLTPNRWNLSGLLPSCTYKIVVSYFCLLNCEILKTIKYEQIILKISNEELIFLFIYFILNSVNLIWVNQFCDIILKTLFWSKHNILNSTCNLIFVKVKVQTQITWPNTGGHKQKTHYNIIKILEYFWNIAC